MKPSSMKLEKHMDALTLFNFFFLSRKSRDDFELFDEFPN